MEIVTTSLEALIQRATCNQNQCPDTAAIDAFCGLINKEPESAQTATRFITAKVHSLHEWEALQALHVLDVCMKRCGANFHAEVGKFRFLNELIKLVSPKYNGAHTPEPVKRRVLELMQAWTVFYPREFKIKEAYDMLKKQGVVKEEFMRGGHKTLEQNIAPPPPRHTDTIFQDMEKSRLLQKLLQSKKPDDLQAANKLIKTMVKEDERRVEQKSRHLSELEAAHNNARLLSEMLDCYVGAASSEQDLELINELQASCVRYKPNVQRLLSEVHDDERLFNEVLAASDELCEVLEKYSLVIVQGLPASAMSSTVEGAVGGNLLDLSTPSEEARPVPAQADSLLCDTLTLDTPLASVVETSLASMELLSSLPTPSLLQDQLISLHHPHPFPSHHPVVDLASLGDIFGSVAQPASTTPLQVSPLKIASEKNSLKTGLEELDAISESLLKQSLPQTAPPQPTKLPVKVPMNQLPLSHHASPIHSAVTSTLLYSSVAADHSNPPPTSAAAPPASAAAPPASAAAPLASAADSVDLLLDTPPAPLQVNGDAAVLDLSDDKQQTPQVKTEPQPQTWQETAVKPLGDVNVPLESIKPGTLPPLTVIEERGISVTIHFGQNCPRPDVSVFVVTTMSKSQLPISDYLFQAIVPKGCRLRLQPASSTELPAHNPFLPPSAITQVLLIASPNKEPILLRVVISFTMDDETVTEMKEVEAFPLLTS